MPVKINPYPQNLSIPQVYPYSYLQKILPCSWNKITHTNKSSHLHHEHIHTSPQHKFLIMPILPKSKPKLIQQHHNLPTLSKFHKPLTLSKLHHDKKQKKQKKKNTTIQKCSKANITIWSIIQCPKLQQSHNKMTMAHHETFNEVWNNIFPSKETKEKLTLMSMWESEHGF